MLRSSDRCFRAKWVQAGARFCVLVLLVASSVRGDVLTVATYNVENYLAANRMIEAGYRRDYPKPESEKQALRAVIRAVNADVLALQEMGPAPYLDELRRDLRTEGVDYPYFALMVGADANRHIALLSKRPLKDVTQHANLEFAYLGSRETVRRGMLEATISTEGGDLTIFVLHLKSRFTERADDPQSATRRAAEATAARDRILRRFPAPEAARFLIVGDLNDSPASKAVQFLSRRGKRAIAEPLVATDARGETWTYVYRKEDAYSRVDYILVSGGLLEAVIGGKALLFDGPETGVASDHRPVVARLKLE